MMCASDAQISEEIIYETGQFIGSKNCTSFSLSCVLVCFCVRVCLYVCVLEREYECVKHITFSAFYMVVVI